MGVTIRKIAPDDYLLLASFYYSFDTGGRSLENWLIRLAHWWEENPAFSEEWCRGFLLCEGETIVGAVASFPTLMQVKGKQEIAFNGTSWKVLEKYRKWSMDLWLCNRDFSENYISFNTTPIESVRKLIERFGYVSIPRISEYCSIQMLDVGFFTDRVSRFVPKSICIFTSRLINASLLLVSRKYKGELEPVSNELSAKHIDDLWEHSRNQYDITNDRSAKSMLWYSKHNTIVGFYRTTQLVGIALLGAVKKSNSTMKYLQVTDFWCSHPHDTQEVMAALVDFVQRSSYFTGFSYLKIPHYSQEMCSACSKRHLWKRKTSSSAYIYLPTQTKQIIDLNNGFFSMLQGDYGV